MSVQDGGPAFPTEATYEYQKANGERVIGTRLTGGMSLRDYFATAALQGSCANSYSDGRCQPLSTANVEQMAELAYQQADAMLKARKVE